MTGLVYGAVGAAALPTATDDNKIFAFEIDLRGRKRFLDLVATVGDGTLGGFACAWAELSRLETMPDSVTERGVAAVLRV